MLTYADACSGVGARNSSVHAVVDKLQTGYGASVVAINGQRLSRYADVCWRMLSVVAINGQRLSRNDLDALMLVCSRMLTYAGVC